MKQIPTASQTVGPFFGIGLGYLCNPSASAQGDTVNIHGCVLDANRRPVSDAILELWQADPDGHYPVNPNASGRAGGFLRLATDDTGCFRFTTCRPGAVPFDETRMQAPHIVVLVFARGLLRHLITRMYFPGESANSSDPVLQSIAESRRGTLVARRESADTLEWNVVLQGADETVFFAW